MAFFQTPPQLGNQWRDDRPLRSLLARVLPKDVFAEIAPGLDALGELAGGRLFQMQLEDRLNEPTLTQWDPWGNRVDRIELTALWKEAAKVACESGLVGIPYEKKQGEFSRLHQAAVLHLFNPSSDIYSCPLAMTDGAAKTLLSHGNKALIDRAVPRLTSRDPSKAWTSGQWMTERTGGSDVGLTETVAKKDGDGFGLWGTKWFTSAATSEMALTLARPEGNGPGGRGLALFYLETRDEQGRLKNIRINRLKDKLGTRKLPTAELSLEGTPAIPVVGLSDGIRNITPMLNITRTWNAICAASGMRRGVALSRDYSQKRVAFGAALSKKPLHAQTLARMEAEYEAALHLAFLCSELLGREEAGTLSEEDGRLLRLVVPLAKLCTGKQVVSVVSEALEVFGGAGYVEDTGVPVLLRDCQVLPIWEGTTNVLSLDSLRAIQKDDALPVLAARIHALSGEARSPKLAHAAKTARAACDHALAWITETVGKDPVLIEAHARSFALTLARSLQLALLVRHAQWSLDHEKDGRSAAAADLFAHTTIDHLDAAAFANEAAFALANDEPLPV